MYVFWDTVTKPLLDIIKPKSIVEIGCEYGSDTNNILDYCKQTGAILHAIDPQPKFDVEAWREQYGSQFVFYSLLSLNALPLVPKMDVVLIDGDHNWYTVYHELKFIEKHAKEKQGHFPVLLLHDVGWPYGRRDMYYDPENIPDSYLKPYKKLGIRPDELELSANSGINAHLCNSIYENELQSGVLTAVEDFLRETSFLLEMFTIPAFNGIGIIYPCGLKENSSFLEFMTGLSSSEYLLQIISQMEKSRNSLRVEKERHRINSKQKEVEIKTLQKELNTQKTILIEQAKELARLKKWFLDLQHHHSALLNSRRWKIGNTLINMLNKLLFRKQTSLVTIKIDQVFSQFNAWNQKKAFDEKNINYEVKQLMSWFEELELRINRLLESRIWKTGMIIGNVLSLKLGHKGEPLPVRKLNYVFQQYHQWAPVFGKAEHDLDQLSSWIKQIRKSYKKLITSRRWKLGNRIISTLRRFAFRKSQQLKTNKIDVIFKSFDEWEKDRKDKDGNDKKSCLDLVYNVKGAPVEAVGEPYELLPPLK